MNFVKNVLLFLTFAMPAIYADIKQPWYKRTLAGFADLFKKTSYNSYAQHPVTLIAGTAVTTGILTSLAWYYFGVRPVKKQMQRTQEKAQQAELILESKLLSALSLNEIIQQDLSNISEDLVSLKQKKNKKLTTKQTALSSLKQERATQQDKIAFAKARVANVSSRKLDDRIADADKALYDLAFKEIEINLDNVILQSELLSLNSIQTRIISPKDSSSSKESL